MKDMFQRGGHCCWSLSFFWLLNWKWCGGFRKRLYKLPPLLLLTWDRFWKSLHKLHHACCLPPEEVFGRIDCTSFKPTSSEAVSSSPLDYTLWIHRPFPYLHFCETFLCLEFCWCCVFTKIQSSEIAEKMSKNHMCMQCLRKESNNLSCFLALLGSKRELQVAWGTDLISLLFSLFLDLMSVVTFCHCPSLLHTIEYLGCPCLSFFNPHDITIPTCSAHECGCSCGDEIKGKVVSICAAWLASPKI